MQQVGVELLQARMRGAAEEGTGIFQVILFSPFALSATILSTFLIVALN